VPWEVGDFAHRYFWQFYKTVLFHRQAKKTKDDNPFANLD
jgi:hypothetical protein